jgi:hypothetical protein
VVVAFGLVGFAAGAALAQEPTPAQPGGTGGAAAPAVPGAKVCTISDERLVELSGLVATADGYIAINDGSDLSSRERVFFLNKKCNVRDDVSYSGNGPRDTEDLALSPDRATLWIADVGDNPDGERRSSVALWKMPADGSKRPEIYRMSYPDGPHDAEALLIGADDLPVIVTKGAKAELYKPTAALKKGATTPLQKVGEVTMPKTTTGNPLGPAGRVAVTGAAAAPDGKRVVLRTYADAFEWDVTGDIVETLTKGEPRVTPLPDEPWGEAITYSADGASFLTVSETAQQEDLEPVILRYTPAKAAPKPVAASAGGGGKEDTRSFFDKLDLGDITAMIGAVGVLGVLLVVAGVLGIVTARRRAAAQDGADGDSDYPVRAAAQVPGSATEILARVRPDQRPYDAEPDGGTVYGAPAGGTVYGGAPGGGAVYGAARPGGAVYGGDRGSGGVYGGGGAGGYRSGRDPDDYGQQDRGGSYRSGGVYGGRDYASGGPPDDVDYRDSHPGNGHGGYRGGAYRGGYRDDYDDGYAEQPAGGPYQDGYGYDDGPQRRS